MNLKLILLSVVLYGSVVLSQEIENGELKVPKNTKDDGTCQEELFHIDETHTFNNTQGHRKLKKGESLDCFGLGSEFANALDWFLRSDANGTNALKVKFHVISRNKPDRVTIMHGDVIPLDKLDVDPRRRTMVVTHGFMADGDEKWIKDMTKALLTWDDLNVVVIDWSHGSNTWNYYKAAVNTRTVGDQIATFFGNLVDAITQSQKVSDDSWGPLHLIGHSLGAHISGYAAKELSKRENKWRVHRITGLDPAQPCFKHSDDKLRLDDTDAPFVDIIHTNGRVLSQLGLGLPNPIGHIDFYPNGGKVQPGCILSQTSLWNYLPIPIKKISQTICSHGRSYLYFIDSVISEVRNGCTFWAHEWDLTYGNIDAMLESNCKDRKCIEMGINAEKYGYHINGTFFTVTGNSKPFCYVDEDSKQEVKTIIEKVKKKLKCGSNEIPDDNIPVEDTLVIYD